MKDLRSLPEIRSKVLVDRPNKSQALSPIPLLFIAFQKIVYLHQITTIHFVVVMAEVKMRLIVLFRTGVYESNGKLNSEEFFN